MEYRLSSGLFDGIFDLNVGGPEAFGLVKEAGTAEGLGGLLNARWGGTAIHTVGDAVGGPGITEADEMDRIVRQYPAVRRAFQDIADKDYGQIMATPAYKAFDPIAHQLADAQDVDEVGDVFKGVLRRQELTFTDKLPSLSWTRLQFGQRLREAVGDMDIAEHQPGFHPLQRLGTIVNPANMNQRLAALPTAWDDATKSISMEAFDPSSKIDDGSRGILQMALFTEKPTVAMGIVNDYHDAPDLNPSCASTASSRSTPCSRWPASAATRETSTCGRCSPTRPPSGQAVIQMRRLLSGPDAPHTEIADQTRVLLAAYDAYQQQLTTGTQDGFIGETESDIDQAWDDNLYATVAAHPGIANVVNGLFLSLPTGEPGSTTQGTAGTGIFTAKSWNQA